MIRVAGPLPYDSLRSQAWRAGRLSVRGVGPLEVIVLLSLMFVSNLAVEARTHAPRAETERYAWSKALKESDDYHYKCPESMVMMGRLHDGDENGHTQYACARISVLGVVITPTPQKWSPKKKESGREFYCPKDQVMVGRGHDGDENGGTTYLCAKLASYNGRPAKLVDARSYGPYKESGKHFLCPDKKVMTSRRHHGDENGGTSYTCATVEFSYNIVSLRSTYKGEEGACIWQNKNAQPRQLCPPYVHYVSHPESLRLSVSGGRLKRNGVNFDTRDADKSHTGKRAIFVMDPEGNLYASNAHKPRLFHHSSILAGGQIAAAGELVVNDGVIKQMTTCSGHYRPSFATVPQLKDTMKVQGYTAPFDVVDCSADMLVNFDLNYMPLNPPMLETYESSELEDIEGERV